MCLRLTFRSRRWVANECLRVWGEISLVIPAAFAYSFTRFQTANRLIRFHNGEGGNRGMINAVELNVLLAPSASYYGLGLPFTLGGNHNQYLRQMNVPAAHLNGATGLGGRIAIVDSGIDSRSSLKIADFYDLESPSVIHAGRGNMADNDGHGTAMASLAAEVAPDAEIYVVRVMDQGILTLWNVLAGAGIAAFDCYASIINLSLGFTGFKLCGVCGATGTARSVALEKLLDGITNSTINVINKSPIYVASVGNESDTNSVNSPAKYNSSVPVGAVNSAGARSIFSNYDQKLMHPRHFMAPGGEKDNANLITEDVGGGPNARCCGTSAATAYASGMLALLWSDPRYPQLARDAFLNKVKLNHCLRQKSQAAHEYGAGIIRY